MNGILLTYDAGRKYYMNEKLVFYSGNAGSINYTMIYPGKANYTSIYNSKDIKKMMTVDKPPYHLAAKLEAGKKNTFMYLPMIYSGGHRHLKP
jgi:hypothetical protein